MDIRRENGWFDVTVPTAQFKELQNLFASKNRRRFHNIDDNGRHVRKGPIISTMPHWVNDNHFLVAQFDPRSPSHIKIYAANAPRGNGYDRFRKRIKLPGSQFPNPKKLDLVLIGDLHADFTNGLEHSHVIGDSFPKITRGIIGYFVGNLKSNISVAGVHEVQRKVDAYILHPLMGAGFGVGMMAIGLAQCSPDQRISQPTPSVTTTTQGR